MTIFSAAERAHLIEMRAISTDSQGREVLVGLTFEETDFYMNYLRDKSDSSMKQRYLKLYEKHESARLAVLIAEKELRIYNQTIQ